MRRISTHQRGGTLYAFVRGKSGMKICIDIQAAVTQRAGVGRYTRALVEHLPTVAEPGDELVLFHFDFLRRAMPLPVRGTFSRACRWCPGRLAQKAWKLLEWPPFEVFAGSADLYHFPNFVLPPLGKDKHAVVTIHDVSFLRYPEFAETKNLAYLRATIPKTVQRADAVVTVSRFCAEEIVAELHAPAERVFAIYNGIDRKFRHAAEDAVGRVRTRLALDRPYLLSVGTIEPRKNFPFLVEVFERLDSFDGYLVIAGMAGWKCKPIFERFRTSARAVRIRWLDHVGDNDLAALYSGAELFLCTSIYEGFGFPPLEAMACGTPVVSSRGGALPEVLGDAALLLEDFDPDRWARAVTDLLASSEERIRLATAGHKQAAHYAWSTTAQQTWEVYRKVMGEGIPPVCTSR
ncbi:MAG: glycosyltransferase family 4 protein [Kiritimatiellia bacterium]